MDDSAETGAQRADTKYIPLQCFLLIVVALEYANQGEPLHLSRRGKKFSPRSTEDDCVIRNQND